MRSLIVFSSQGKALSQEDHVYVKKDKGLFTIADGFGGEKQGALAAKHANDSIAAFLEKEAGDLEATLPFVLRKYFSLAGNVLFNAILFANKNLLLANKGKNYQEMGGASVLAAYLDGDLFALANTGTCSAWIIRHQTMRELVVPRSYGRLVNPLVIDVDDEQAVPLMALGMTDDVEPEIVEFKVQEGDTLLLQTDGIHQQARDVIMNALDDEKLMEAKLSELEYTDNATVSIIRF